MAGKESNKTIKHDLCNIVEQIHGNPKDFHFDAVKGLLTIGENWSTPQVPLKLQTSCILI